MSHVLHLECSRCRKTFSHRELHNLCRSCEFPLLVRYDLAAVGRRFKKTDLLNRPAHMWRYRELLPVDSEEDIVTLGEGFTPLLSLERLGGEFGFSHLYLKDEGVNPTGSFKARGLAAAVSIARKLGAVRLSIPSAGNAGGALGAYGARAGLEAFIFIPEDTPSANVVETRMTGAHVELVPGVITDAARVMGERKDAEGWFDVSTLKEPYRLEGKKTMGFELAEQLGWILPDVIVYPTGGGTGLIGFWKAFDEMEEMGWIGEERPRMVAVQAAGCAPIVKAFEEGKSSSEPWPDPHTLAAGLRVPKALGDFLILDVLRRSEGTAVAVSDGEILDAVGEIGRAEGVFVCPEGAACWAALKKLRGKGWVQGPERVLILNTGAGLKYVDTFLRFEREGGERQA